MKYFQIEMVPIAIVIVIFFIPMTYVQAFWPFDDGKPAKPKLGLVTNPEMIKEFDALYNKYPNITQEDVNNTHHQLTLECASGAETPLDQFVQLSMCKGFMSGMMEDYLDGLGMNYWSNPNGEIPTLYDSSK